MLYRLTNKKDLETLPSGIIQAIGEDITISLELLEREYGSQRNSDESGGYVLLAETVADLEQVKTIVNIDTHPCEYAEYAGVAQNYVVAVYQLNNDYGIDLYLPLAIVPDVLKEEL